MYGYVHVCTYMYTHVPMHTCIYIHIYMYTYIDVPGGDVPDGRFESLKIAV